MSEASERLRQLEADHVPGGWPAVQMCDITAVLDELDALKAEKLEWLRIVYDLLAQLHEIEEGQERLAAIYTERGKMVAAMRELLNQCS